MRTQKQTANLENASELQERLVLMRRYVGTRDEVVAAWGLNDPHQLDQLERSNLKTLIKLAEYADRLGIEIEFKVKLPKE